MISLQLRIPHILILLSFPFAVTSCGNGTEGGDSSRRADPSIPLVARDSTAPVDRVVRLTGAQAAELNIRTTHPASGVFTYMITVPGVASPSPGHIAVVSAPVSGRVTGLAAYEGSQVRKGQLLFEIESRELSDLVAEYIQAQADQEYNSLQLDRTRTLAEQNISAQRTLEKAEADYTHSVVAVRAARARLLALGVSSTELTRWLSDDMPQPTLKLFAPLSGYITDHRVDKGEAVAALDRMATIVDPSVLFIRGFVAPEEGVHLRLGAAVEVLLPDQPDRSYTTTVASINPALDEKNRSVVVYATLSVPGCTVRAGQTVQLRITATTDTPVLTLPLSAIEYEGNDATVFVKRDDSTYVKRRLVVGRMTDTDVIVQSGLSENDNVAVSQVFSLKALARFEDFAE